MSVLTLATCWKIMRTDGVILGFTEHDEKLLIDEVIYLPVNIHKTSALKNHSDLSFASSDISIAIDSDKILENDLLNGLYDRAEIIIFMIDYENLDNVIKLRKGNLGSITIQEGKFHVEVLSIIDKLSCQIINDVYSPTCRAKFCDAKCGLKRENYDEFAYCDKSFSMCNTYKNAINFRGEPHIPSKISINR